MVTPYGLMSSQKYTHRFLVTDIDLLIKAGPLDMDGPTFTSLYELLTTVLKFMKKVKCRSS
jgi:hypothetical protein